MSNNYDKNTIDPVLMADCNSPSVKISRFGKDTLNSTYTEGIATPTEGLILTAYPKRSTWNSQMALPNGVNARPYVRGVSANSWSKWKEVTLKDDLAPTLEEIAQPSVSGITFSQWVATAEKSGNEVTLSFNANGNMPAMSSIVKILTLPTKYRPKSNKYVSYVTQEGYIMLLAIYTDGTLNLFNNNKAVSGFILRQAITYPIA